MNTKHLLILLAVSGISTAQAGLLSDNITFQDQVIPLSKSSYLLERDKLKSADQFHTANLEGSTSFTERQSEACKALDNKFQQLALASANIKYDEAYNDYNNLKQEIEYNIKLNTIASIACNI